MLNRTPSSVFSTIMKTFLLAFSIVLVNFANYAEFTQFDATYKARFDKFKAKSRMSLRHDTQTGIYTYSTYTKPKGLARLFGKITESLTFEYDQNTIIPKAYRHNSRNKAQIDYDWKKKQASSRTDDGSEVLSLTGNELDLLSLQMQLTRDLKNNSLKQTYSIIKDNELKTYKVTELGEDSFKVGKKTYQTFKIQQQREGSSRRSVLHFAPELDYILVKMQQFKGDKQRASFLMSSYKALDITPNASN